MCPRTVACQKLIQRVREAAASEPSEVIAWALDIARRASQVIIQAEKDEQPSEDEQATA